MSAPHPGYRTRQSHILAAAAIVLAAGCSSESTRWSRLLGSGTPQSGLDSGPSLVACSDQGAGPSCLKSLVRLEPAVARGGLAQPSNWSADLGGLELPVTAVSIPDEGLGSTRLLVLVDVGASMAGGALTTARSALRGFLSTLPPEISVAVAPFSSVRVEERLSGASFSTPEVAAGELLDLPAPARNSALYSAIALGTRSFDQNRTDATLDMILVITDGGNEVGAPGDDPGLLSGAAGRQTAIDALLRNGTFLWVIGVGTADDRSELEALTEGTGTWLDVPLPNPVLMGRALGEATRSLQVDREIVVQVPHWARRTLDRGRTTYTLTRMVPDSPDARASNVWTGPRFTPASHDGPPAAVVLSDVGTLPLQEIPWVRRSATLLLFGLLALLVLQIGPSILWPHGSGSAVRGSGDKRRLKKRRGDKPNQPPRGLRPEMLSAARAAAPRGVEDVTASMARRTEP